MYPSPYTTVVNYNKHSFYLASLGTSGIFAPLPDTTRKYPNIEYSIERRDVLTRRCEASVGYTLWLVRRTPFRSTRGLPLAFFHAELAAGTPISETEIEMSIKQFGCRLPDVFTKAEKRPILQALKACFS